MLTKELLQKHPSSACDNQSTRPGTYYLIFQSGGRHKKTPSSQSQPRQQYLYLTNLFAICSKLPLKHPVGSLFLWNKIASQTLLVGESLRHRLKRDLLLKNTCCSGLLSIPHQNTLLLVLHLLMD